MRARATQVQPLDGRAVAAPTRYGTHEQNLVESELSVVEALLGRLQLHLVGANLEDLRNTLRETAMRAGRHELHMDLYAPVRTLNLDVRSGRVLAVLGVVVGPLQIVERGGDAEGRVRGRRFECQRAAGDHAACLDVAHGACEVRVELDRKRLQRGAWRGARCDERCLDRLSAFLEHHAGGRTVPREHRGTRAAPDFHARQLGQRLRDVRTGRAEDAYRAAGMMMQKVELRATRTRSLLQVPDAERAEQSLQDVALEPVVDHLGDRHRQDVTETDATL